jgi:sugar/nucleoside kinase (ribokinase family)
MSLLVVGSVAYDTIETHSERRNDVLGGSASYFSIASSYFTEVKLIAIVGNDFKEQDIDMFNSHAIDLSGLEIKSGKTFRWSGVYGKDVNNRETLRTDLNVFSDFSPKLGLSHIESPYLFLANIDPQLQLDVLTQMKKRPRLTALDTMNFWIESSKASLINVIREVDILFIDTTELLSLTGETNIIRAARQIQNMGPAIVVVKKGEYGATLFNEDSIFIAPAYPIDNVIDPTGAGDSFAGGFMGVLAANEGKIDDINLRRATIIGSLMGAYAVQNFSVHGLDALKLADVTARYNQLWAMSKFGPIEESDSFPSVNSGIVTK